ncbi:hypothetical protein LBR03_22980 [Levilactobacillus brevis]|nr:hypothetical protein LBR03_22980 [Levilactobacillus brevis]
MRRPQFWGHVQSTYPLIVKRSPQFWGNFGAILGTSQKDVRRCD